MKLLQLKLVMGLKYGITLKDFLNMEDIKKLIKFLQKQLEK